MMIIKNNNMMMDLRIEEKRNKRDNQHLRVGKMEKVKRNKRKRAKRKVKKYKKILMMKKKV